MLTPVSIKGCRGAGGGGGTRNRLEPGDWGQGQRGGSEGACWAGLQLQLILVSANRPLSDRWSIWRGVPVLTTYTPSARGLGGYAL